MLSNEQALELAAMGTGLGPAVLARCTALFEAEQKALALALPPAATDLRYGPDVRHHLDIYQPDGGQSGLPVLVFVHGGGFVLGDKGDAGAWMNANVGRAAARMGFLGVVINYRLAPAHVWPAGGQDVGLAVEWLRDNAASYGGDPDRIVLVGTSAGAVHVSTFLQLSPAKPAVRAAVLLSGLYGFTTLEERDELYYGDASGFADRSPRKAVVETDVPLLIVCAQFDPARFQAEFLGLLQGRFEREGSLPRAGIISGHNHYSLAMHLGTADTRLADEIAAFVKDTCQ